MKYTVIAALAVLVAAIAEPQPAVLELMHYMDGTAVCLDVAMTRQGALACAGQGATLCMDTETDGYTTLGMCFARLPNTRRGTGC